MIEPLVFFVTLDTPEMLVMLKELPFPPHPHFVGIDSIIVEVICRLSIFHICRFTEQFSKAASSPSPAPHLLISSPIDCSKTLTLYFNSVISPEKKCEVPLPRIPVTTRMTLYFWARDSGIPINLHLPLAPHNIKCLKEGSICVPLKATLLYIV